MDVLDVPLGRLVAPGPPDQHHPARKPHAPARGPGALQAHLAAPAAGACLVVVEAVACQLEQELQRAMLARQQADVYLAVAQQAACEQPVAPAGQLAALQAQMQAERERLLQHKQQLEAMLLQQQTALAAEVEHAATQPTRLLELAPPASAPAAGDAASQLALGPLLAHVYQGRQLLRHAAAGHPAAPDSMLQQAGTLVSAQRALCAGPCWSVRAAPSVCDLHW